MGYLQIGKSVAMVLELGAGYKAYYDAEDTVLDSDKNLKDWVIPLKDAFESTVEVSSQYANAHERALKKDYNICHFSLYAAGKPISSITLSIHKNIARIDDLGTLPELQGRGYATCLLKHALGQALKLGATHCFLDASVAGLSLYRKLGFKPLYKNIIYEQIPQNGEHINEKTFIIDPNRWRIEACLQNYPSGSST
jgi:GNAT superfamily N-acetyltransferase